MGTRAANAGLGVLSAVAAGCVGLAFAHVAGGAPNAGQPIATASPSATRTLEPASFTSVRRMLDRDDDLTISVLGDSTGNDRGEWVDLLAEEIGNDHRVTYHGWNDSIDDFLPPVEYGTSGPKVAVWNFSSPGKTAAFPADKLDKAQPEEPDLVVFNFGHNNSLSNVEGELNTTRDAIRDKWKRDLPMVAIVQNPEIGPREYGQALVRETVTGWAARHKMPAVDVASAFTAKGDYSPLMKDGIHPNGRGSQLWADTVAKAFGVS